MFLGKVACPDWETCGATTNVSIEWESASDESEHKVNCCGCGKEIAFRVVYSPEIQGEEFTQE